MENEGAISQASENIEKESGSSETRSSAGTVNSTSSEERKPEYLVNASELIKSELSSAIEGLKASIVSEVTSQIVNQVNKELENKINIQVSQYKPVSEMETGLNERIENTKKFFNRHYNDETLEQGYDRISLENKYKK